MNTLLFGIILSALFSATSLLVVLLRVSPITAPAQAVPAFFLSLFLTITTVGALVFIAIWKIFTVHTWDMGKLTSIALRQGIILGICSTTLVLFFKLNLLNWWIGGLIVGVGVLVEAALEH